MSASEPSITKSESYTTGILLIITIRAYVELKGAGDDRDHLIHGFPIYFGCRYPTALEEKALRSLEKNIEFEAIQNLSKHEFKSLWMASNRLFQK
jgi:hypothetical protein